MSRNAYGTTNHKISLFPLRELERGKEHIMLDTIMMLSIFIAISFALMLTIYMFVPFALNALMKILGREYTFKTNKTKILIMLSVLIISTVIAIPTSYISQTTYESDEKPVFDKNAPYSKINEDGTVTYYNITDLERAIAESKYNDSQKAPLGYDLVPWEQLSEQEQNEYIVNPSSFPLRRVRTRDSLN